VPFRICLFYPPVIPPFLELVLVFLLGTPYPRLSRLVPHPFFSCLLHAPVGPQVTGELVIFRLTPIESSFPARITGGSSSHPPHLTAGGLACFCAFILCMFFPECLGVLLLLNRIPPRIYFKPVSKASMT